MSALTSLESWIAVLQVLAAVAVIVLVLLQQGKGADMGASFGSGSAGSIFGAAGAANFFSRMTKWAAIVFFACTLLLAYINGQGLTNNASTTTDTGVMQGYVAPKAESTEVPVAPVNNDAANTQVPAPVDNNATNTQAPATK
ncbi:preprotein translocase subunit SecG [Basilea psittacipulmonis]|uniref:Protein-export membrane protein SecG n=1 Tax=Basilea psittacipulmonis DSM 24701 TaxID=1072685 RepID=A0A077DCM3_9BURK|nr:preprotein translocase subunit SecG [Basilea psittacipulmonis]AIL32349.1 hypothetical protein IX83_02560 [Basilea psittacipulmonis DSM 24701]